MEEGNGSGVGLTVRELVLEVRHDVKQLKETIVTKEEAHDFESRIRLLERWKYGIPAVLIVVVANFVSIHFIP